MPCVALTVSVSANVFTLSTVTKSEPNVVVSSFVQPMPMAINKKAADEAANKSLLCKAINFSKILDFIIWQDRHTIVNSLLNQTLHCISIFFCPSLLQILRLTFYQVLQYQKLQHLHKLRRLYT